MISVLFEFMDVVSLLAYRLTDRENLQLVATFLDRIHDVAPPRHKKYVLQRKINCLRTYGNIDNCMYENRGLRRMLKESYRRYRWYNAIHYCSKCYRYSLLPQQLSLYVADTCLECEHKYYCSACKTKPTRSDRCFRCVVKNQYFATPWFKAEPESCILSV